MNLLDGNIGIPRKAMPQLAGFPAKGSKAEKLARERSFGGVDLGAVFWNQLVAEGARLSHYRESPTNLRATQSELNMEKVHALAKLVREGKLAEQCLWISSDNHIIDGHHRWAASVLAGAKDVPVSKIDMPIRDVLKRAIDFQVEWGIPTAA